MCLRGGMKTSPLSKYENILNQQHSWILRSRNSSLLWRHPYKSKIYTAVERWHTPGRAAYRISREHLEGQTKNSARRRRALLTKGIQWFDVAFSFCWFNLEVGWYFLGQKISWSCWQAFIYFCRLHQVWKGTGKHVLISSLKCLLSMLRCLLGSVKSENPKGKGKLGNGKLRNKIIVLN